MSGESQLDNERREQYARFRAKGMIPAKAAIAAGFASGSGTYSTLEKDGEIIARIQHLKELHEEDKIQRRAAKIASARTVGEQTGYSRAWVLQQLAENAARASQDGEYKSANEALKLIGDDLGMFKGGSGPDGEDGDVPKDLDLDALGALKDGWDAITDRKDDPVIFDEDERAKVAASLIEGHNPSSKVDPKDRALSMGSETDVAFEEPDVDTPAPAEDASTEEDPS